METSEPTVSKRPRLRDLGITIGEMPTGPANAITDVPGVCVGHCTLIWDEPRVARTGVTMVVPREGAIWRNHAFAGFHSFNGNGEVRDPPLTGRACPWATAASVPREASPRQ
jgi:D-aminopeptidase